MSSNPELPIGYNTIGENTFTLDIDVSELDFSESIMGELVVKRDGESETIDITSSGGGTLQARKVYADEFNVQFVFEPVTGQANMLKLTPFAMGPDDVSDEWEITGINIY